MTELTTTITGADQVAAHLARLPQIAAEAQHVVIKVLGDRYVLALKAETPVGASVAPGAEKIINSYQVEESYGMAGASYRARNRAPQLHYVIKGRGKVYAISAKALRFVINDVVFFRRSVGPAAPNDFPARVADKMRGEVAAAKAQLPGLIVRQYGGGS
jgi:hypothetical protein